MLVVLHAKSWLRMLASVASLREFCSVGPSPLKSDCILRFVRSTIRSSPVRQEESHESSGPDCFPPRYLFRCRRYHCARCGSLSARQQVRAVGVCDKHGVLLGVVSQSDVSDKVAAENKCPAWMRVSEIMTRQLVSATPDTSLEDCLRLMEAARHLSFGGAGSRKGLPRHDFRNGPAATICL